MSRLLLTHCRLLDPERASLRAGALLVEDGRIRAGLQPDAQVESARRVDLAGAALAPGFVDVHFHGSLVFGPPAHASERLAETGRQLVRHGTTAYLPTTVAWPGAALRQRLEAWTAALGEPTGGGEPAAAPLGIHLEGPWIRPEAAGAQPTGGIRAYDPAEGRALFDLAAGAVRMVTFAPEVEGAGALEEALARRGIVPALGHSLADAACVEATVRRGAARHVTHLFNAMGPLHHRRPGLAGVALAEPALSCDLICDGVHVHPAAVRLAARAKGPALLLVTDAVDPGRDADFGGGAIRDDGEALRLPDGTLAGSTLRMDRAVQNACAFGAMTLAEAVAAATSRPARLLGVEAERGTLRPGARADLVALDDRGRVQQVWVGGAALPSPRSGIARSP